MREKGISLLFPGATSRAIGAEPQWPLATPQAMLCGNVPLDVSRSIDIQNNIIQFNAPALPLLLTTYGLGSCFGVVDRYNPH